ncbi:calcineurin-like phosphoesterase C-terminal domain-containing protein [Tellurirhabdus bombi]|uniref:calcineurin-like phosphoesterase C-terminal domain-containing protein n=1 Tax=Tellurirhabdus bombi TaxID=2907205 RepID=UPI001F26B6E5|nr:calcineurin-like phosphoesterase family protein [Tellurirhabdus bombi]
MRLPNLLHPFLLSLLFPLATPVLAQNQAQGVVFEDKNSNGKKDRQEAGLAQVAVSNGKDVVLTDQKGYYQLPVGQDNIIFVIKPTGYRLPVNAQNLPQFFYRHKPQGSPKQKFAGVAPTGPLPKSIDFGLTKQTEPDAYQVLVFGDPQVYNTDQVGYFERGVIAELQGKTKGFSFGMSLGDLVGDNPPLFEAYNSAIRKLDLPWFQVMGNHDMNHDAKQDSLSDESFEAMYGPNTYAFNQGKVHFIVLDDILSPDPRDGAGYQGGLRPDQLAFVEADLKTVPKDYLVVLCHHIPLFSEGDSESFRKADRQRLLSFLKDFPHTLSLSAHTHIQQHYFHGQVDGLERATPHHEYNVGTTSGDWYSGEDNEQGVPASTMRDGTPKGYLFLSFNGNQYSFDYRIAGQPETYKIGLYAPKSIKQGQVGRNDVYANFFQGSHRDSVSYRVDGGNWKKMILAEEADPTMLGVRYRWDAADQPLKGIKPSAPIVSTHLWKARLGGNLPVGEHNVEVQVKDAYGRTFTNKTSFRVVAP